MYIQLYSNKNYTAVFNNELRVHYKIIQWFNYFIIYEKNKIYRLNLIRDTSMQENKFHIGNNISGIIDVSYFISENFFSIDKLVNKYILLLSEILDSLKVSYQALDLENKILNGISKEADFISSLKWNKNKTLSYNLSFKIHLENNNMNLLLNLYSDGKMIKKINFSNVICGIDIKDILKFYIKKHKWIDLTTVVIYQKNEQNFWIINTETEIVSYKGNV